MFWQRQVASFLALPGSERTLNISSCTVFACHGYLSLLVFPLTPVGALMEHMQCGHHTCSHLLSTVLCGQRESLGMALPNIHLGGGKVSRTIIRMWDGVGHDIAQDAQRGCVQHGFVVLRVCWEILRKMSQ